ncbi:MAG: uridine diphosphate-N-acetylglucosamine-binding protein YvcK [Acidobacteria bacterium]|nr:uridine diphosphate-N-acetylglucosamine-binding protein YvcK [Acidobacteriota bacterium]
MNVVAIGGGTGLSTLLRGLKTRVGAAASPSISSLSAIVTVTDEGGSSGILRKELGMLPPGDIRNCIIALAQEERLLSQLFAYRFGSEAVQGHSFGNLALAALTRITGSFDKAILAVSEVLRVNGAIFPSTLADVRVRATCADGTELVGELAISGDPTEPLRPRPEHARIVHLAIDPPDAEPIPEALAAIDAAELILIGPGSLYTSILPNLVICGLADAIARSRARRVYICNVMTQPGETDGYSAEEHLATILDHAGPIVDVMIVNDRRPSDRTLEAYASQHQHPVAYDPLAVQALGVRPFLADIISEGNYVRHDSAALAETVFRLAETR